MRKQWIPGPFSGGGRGLGTRLSTDLLIYYYYIAIFILWLDQMGQTNYSYNNKGGNTIFTLRQPDSSERLEHELNHGLTVTGFHEPFNP